MGRYNSDRIIHTVRACWLLAGGVLLLAGVGCGAIDDAARVAPSVADDLLAISDDIARASAIADEGQRLANLERLAVQAAGLADNAAQANEAAQVARLSDDVARMLVATSLEVHVTDEVVRLERYLGRALTSEEAVSLRQTILDYSCFTLKQSATLEQEDINARLPISLQVSPGFSDQVAAAVITTNSRFWAEVEKRQLESAALAVQAACEVRDLP